MCWGHGSASRGTSNTLRTDGHSRYCDARVSRTFDKCRSALQCHSIHTRCTLFAPADSDCTLDRCCPWSLLLYGIQRLYPSRRHVSTPQSYSWQTRDAAARHARPRTDREKARTRVTRTRVSEEERRRPPPTPTPPRSIRKKGRREPTHTTTTNQLAFKY